MTFKAAESSPPRGRCLQGWLQPIIVQLCLSSATSSFTRSNFMFSLTTYADLLLSILQASWQPVPTSAFCPNHLSPALPPNTLCLSLVLFPDSIQPLHYQGEARQLNPCYLHLCRQSSAPLSAHHDSHYCIVHLFIHFWQKPPHVTQHSDFNNFLHL